MAEATAPWPYLILFMLTMALRHTCTCKAEILSLFLRNNSRGFIPISTFGFTSTGHIDLQGSHVSWTGGDNSTIHHPASMGFWLIRHDERLFTSPHLLKNPAPNCSILHKDSIPLALVTFKDSNGWTGFSSNLSVPNANLFTLSFVNCDPKLVQVSMDLRASLYNLEGKDGTKNYLPDGLTHLPALFFSFSAIHTALLIAWMHVCMKQKQAFHRIHTAMGMLVFVKALFMLTEAGVHAYIKHRGLLQKLKIASYIFSFLKGVMLFIVILLVGAGWSILKPHLQGKERRLLAMVVLLQVLANLPLEVVIGVSELFFKEWQLPWNVIIPGLAHLHFLIDVVCCCAVLFPTAWSIKRLRLAAQTHDKAATNLVKLTLLRHYSMAVVCYIFFTRVVDVLALATWVTSYRYTWVGILASEMATLAFYVFTGYKFRPAAPVNH